MSYTLPGDYSSGSCVNTSNSSVIQFSSKCQSSVYCRACHVKTVKSDWPLIPFWSFRLGTYVLPMIQLGRSIPSSHHHSSTSSTSSNHFSHAERQSRLLRLCPVLFYQKTKHWSKRTHSKSVNEVQISTFGKLSFIGQDAVSTVASLLYEYRSIRFLNNGSWSWQEQDKIIPRRTSNINVDFPFFSFFFLFWFIVQRFNVLFDSMVGMPR